MKLYWLNRITGKPLKVYVIFTLTIGSLFALYYFYLKPQSRLMKNPAVQRLLSTQNQLHNSKPPFNGAKIVHLDLKGAPPRVSYYKTLFPLLSKLGATGILMEYEDMFPYSTPLVKNVSALNAYTYDDIKYLNEVAKENNLEIIPLVQTFGHMEFLLKLEEYQEFREVPGYPQVICPTHPKTIDLLVEMVEQVIEMHPNSNIIHIGADEVYFLGFCDRCTNIMNKFNLSKQMLFLEHINAVTSRIHKKYPNHRILMWDDEFRSFTLKELKDGYINKFIEPVVWKYTKDVYDALGPSLWGMYSQVFPRIWVASAFKGATGSNEYMSDVTHYVQNHRSWLSVINEYENQVNFQGIILTGWQRYDHFAVLCELLPVSLPALAMSLRVIMGFKDSPLSPPTNVARILGCEQPYGLIGPAFGSPRCSYMGGDILENALKLHQLKQEFETMMEESRVKGWMSNYNRMYDFSNRYYVQTVTAPLRAMQEELAQIDSEMTFAMLEMYDNYTITEWIETYIRPFKRELQDMEDARERILAKKSWPRRPLPSCGRCNEL